jgi:putative transposase
MANKREILVPGGFYHIYNRAISEDRLFTEDLEYSLFIKKYMSYSNLIFRTYSFCLLSNHFHFLIQVKSDSELKRNFGIFKDDKSRSNNMAQHLGNFFNWYATYFNKKHSRKGSLFIHSFHRKPILDQSYLTQVICYIHSNPVKAGQCTNLADWKFSSYREYFNGSKYIPSSNLKETIEWFDGLEYFKDTHTQYLILNSRK